MTLYIHIYIVFTTLKHRLDTDVLDENITFFLMLFQYHQESVQFNIILALLNIIFKHNLKKLLKSFGIFFVQCQGYENYCKVVEGVQKLFRLF